MLRSQANWNYTYNETKADVSPLDQMIDSDLTKQLLWQRGITTADQAARFLHPDLNHLHDPGLLHDIDKACLRVKEAIANKEHILVYGDYDADGVSSTAVMMEALLELGAICEFYIPNRFTEGYGPNEVAFKEAKEQGFQLIITVDNGIAAVQEAEVAKQLGIDLIITDHHEAQKDIPTAFAIIHPKCSKEYPFKELAGVGVAFKFAQHLLGYFPSQLLDLVVIGTIADLVPLVAENRVLAHFGLKAISNSNRPGIKALKKVCNIEGPITEEQIGFMIGPRMNAVGRLQEANPAVDLLLTKDMDQAVELAAFVQDVNQERQVIVSEIAKEAEQMVNETAGDADVIIVAKEGWNEGVLGIVASKLVKKFDRPAIVLSIHPQKGEAKGSARSIDAFDLFSSCMEIREHFTRFGGHAQAAGMTLPIDRIDIVRNKLHAIADRQLSPEDFKPVLSIDATTDIDALSISGIAEIEKLAPFGMGNPKPLFFVKGSVKEIRQIGSRQNHLKLTMANGQALLDGVGFGMGNLYHQISKSSMIHAVGELGINEWNGRQKVQIMLKDFEIPEWQLFDYRGVRSIEKQVAHVLPETALAIQLKEHPPRLHELSVPVLSYQEVMNQGINNAHVKDLILLEMPATLDDLSEIVADIRPERIFACYQLDGGSYLKGIPTREEFKWFYAMMLKRKQFHFEKELDKLAAFKGWSVDKIKFISKVFFELEFVKIEDGILYPISKPTKKDLTESELYQQRLQQLDLEEILYYSNYTQLKNWLQENMKAPASLKEEVMSGL
ncbi:single-stranded-DNA-specific exonuclease RecJ [Aquibacillus sp. 3ASR75-11]|uniref:Single-stranded-DNA-specific exonuclease RecJ n=1 Tax=Terrihalobacillus insolitus TaxID=2950438 RepID=A0A9X4AL47_9BACI|nr:single-stranded-DNA-specific exonuclease RecJ [Terrihalobacillus insolitus]MDC3423851.1 single-stranded-DNA-specific exonuclease RecJ [Terrihalobacillus insolitus]